MGWEESTPLEPDQIRSQDKALDLPRPLNGNEASFLTIDDPDLLLDTWKPAEDGKGTILRFIDLGGEPRTVTIHTPLLIDNQDRRHGCSRTGSEADCAGGCTHF
jgi:alpha-mannosidase